MPVLLEDQGRQYQRLRHTPEEKQYLAANGLQNVLSSNISAVGRLGTDLVVRFHNGSLYEYPGSADAHYQAILKANSKGRYFWNNIRIPDLPYNIIGALRLPGDIDIADADLFADIEEKSKLVEVLFESEPDILEQAALLTPVVKLLQETNVRLLTQLVGGIKIL
jgi:hypothetical protein